MGDSLSRSRQRGNLPSGTGQLQNVQAGVGTIGNVDISAIVDVDVVGLDRHFAPLRRSRTNAALVGFAGDRRDVIGDFLRMIWIADVDCAYAGVEMREEHHALVIDRREVLVRRVRAEAPATS